MGPVTAPEVTPEPVAPSLLTVFVEIVSVLTWLLVSSVLAAVLTASLETTPPGIPLLKYLELNLANQNMFST